MTELHWEDLRDELVGSEHDDEWWATFAEAIEHIIEDLEQDDFFGTEGLNKRFA